MRRFFRWFVLILMALVLTLVFYALTGALPLLLGK